MNVLQLSEGISPKSGPSLIALLGGPHDAGPSAWFGEEPFSACSLGLPSLVAMVTTLVWVVVVLFI